MGQERVKVLEMLAAGKITIDQASQLIEALSGEADSLAEQQERDERPDSPTTILEPQQALPQQDFNSFTFDQAIAMGTVGVKQDFVRKVREAGLTDLSFEQIIQMGTVGIEPDYVLKVREAGLTDLSFEQIIQMGTVGIEPEFIRSMRDAGVLDLTKGRDQNSLQHDLHITGEFTLYSLAPRDVTVASGGRLILYGRVARDLILKSGASIDFQGTVGRNFYNQSGAVVDLYGVVDRDVYNSPGSRINLYGQVKGDIYSRTEDLSVSGTLKGSVREEIHAEQSDNF